MRFIWNLLFRPYVLWIIISVAIYLYRNQIKIVFDRLGRRRDRIRFLREQTINRHDARSRLELGLVQFRHRHFTTAGRLFQEARAIEPDNPEIHYQLGLTLLQTNHWHDAAASFAKCLELKPDYGYGEAAVRLGDAHFRLREWRTAAACYQQALEQNPYGGEALYKAGVSQFKLKDVDAARRYLEEAMISIRALPRFRFKKERIWLYKTFLFRLIHGI